MCKVGVGGWGAEFVFFRADLNVKYSICHVNVYDLCAQPDSEEL